VVAEEVGVTVLEPSTIVSLWVNEDDALVIVIVLAVPMTKSPDHEQVLARGIVVSVRLLLIEAEPGE
jgi:hypothetical protein